MLGGIPWWEPGVINQSLPLLVTILGVRRQEECEQSGVMSLALRLASC